MNLDVELNMATADFMHSFINYLKLFSFIFEIISFIYFLDIVRLLRYLTIT